MKLVIEYSVGGDWGSSYDIVRCCEYESDVAFLVHFEEKLKEKIEEHKTYEKEYKQWQKLRHQMEQDAWLEMHPNFDEKFYIANMKFDMNDFYSRDYYSEHEKKIDLPEVHELNDWFQTKVSDTCNYEYSS